MKRYLAALAAAFLVLLAVASPASATPRAKPKRPPKPVVVSFVVSPTALPSSGGTVNLTARVRNATTCTFGGAGTITVACAHGIARAKDQVVANNTATERSARIWLRVRGRGGVAPLRSVVITEAGMPTKCTGPCRFVFPQPSSDDVVSVTLNSLAQGIACPDPSLGCDTTAAQQLDDANVTVCAGPQGISDVADEISNFSLTLSDGSQASTDFVTYDSSVPTAFGNYGAVAPNQCVTGDIYLDAPGGSTWTSLNFSYEAGLTSLVYVWSAA